MSNFYYFLPGQKGQTITLDDLRRADLGYVFDDANFYTRDVIGIGGPDGKVGTVVAINDYRIGCFLDQQTWSPHPTARVDDEVVHVGYYNDDPPNVASLLRDRVLPGHRIKLLDGHEWAIPVVRGVELPDNEADPEALPKWFNALPCVSGLCPEAAKRGETVWRSHETEPRFAYLWPLACGYYEHFSRTLSITDDDEADGEGDRQFAADAEQPIEQPFAERSYLLTSATSMLSCNYRIGPVEAAMLGLFDDLCDKACEVMRAAIDWPTVQPWIEKKSALAGDGSASSVGPEGNPSPVGNQR